MLDHKITSEHVTGEGWIHTCEWVLRSHGFLKIEMRGTLAMFQRVKETVMHELERTASPQQQVVEMTPRITGAIIEERKRIGALVESLISGETAFSAQDMKGLKETLLRHLSGGGPAGIAIGWPT